MSKETRIWVASLLMPLILAVCGWINAQSEATKSERQFVQMSDSFQEYVEYVMRQKGCEP